MNKVEALYSLREYIKKGENITSLYAMERDNGTCYCAVGYLMRECGIPDVKLFEYKSRGIKLIAQYENDNQTIQNFINEFGLVELKDIQLLNDDEATGELLDYIDNMIDKAVQTP